MSESREQKTENKLIIGYYPIRGKAQVARLLCEYLGIPYQDQFYELQEWNALKNQKAQIWDFADLPYLEDEGFTVTQAFPICEYILEKYDSMWLLGKNLQDQAIVQMYLWTIDTMGGIISVNCSKVPEEERESFKETQWKNNVLPRMLKYQQFVRGEEWFLGYLSIIDFSVYQLIRYMAMLFPNKTTILPNLNRIANMILNLPKIKEYEESPRAVKQMDPSTLLKRLKQTSN